MTRQIGEIASSRNRVWFHITSTNPIRPANQPDPWEQSALEAFLSEEPESYEFIEMGEDNKLFRFMAPLWVEKTCLKCHAKQGYNEGDLRGGISVSIEADPLFAAQDRNMKNLSIAYGVLWAIGLLGIVLGMGRLSKEEGEKEEVLRELQTALTEAKTLSGLLPICASCKKIRDDSGYWNHLEAYFESHSDASFTHGICPDCARKLYPDLKEEAPNT
jgi:hypothetical protein